MRAPESVADATDLQPAARRMTELIQALFRDLDRTCPLRDRIDFALAHDAKRQSPLRNVETERISPIVATSSPMQISLRDFGFRRRRARGQFAICGLDFSASETRWRRGWDSNPRGTFIPAGFQDRCLQPLGHPSSGSFRIYRICGDCATICASAAAIRAGAAEIAARASPSRLTHRATASRNKPVSAPNVSSACCSVIRGGSAAPTARAKAGRHSC